MLNLQSTIQPERVSSNYLSLAGRFKTDRRNLISSITLLPLTLNKSVLDRQVRSRYEAHAWRGAVVTTALNAVSMPLPHALFFPALRRPAGIATIEDQHEPGEP